MPTKFLWHGILGVLILLIAGGCSSDLNSRVEEMHNSSSVSSGPGFSLVVDGRELIEGTDKLLAGAYRKGMTLRELLKGSGVVEFAEDGAHLLAIKNYSLDPRVDWKLQVDGTTLDNADWDKPVGGSAKIVVTAEETVQTVILQVNGGSDQPEITRYYILPFEEDLSVRRLLKNSGLVQLAEDNHTVVSVQGYKPLTNELWKLRVNDKPLMDNGMDMKLRPQDKLEISLVAR